MANEPKVVIKRRAVSKKRLWVENDKIVKARGIDPTTMTIESFMDELKDEVFHDPYAHIGMRTLHHEGDIVHRASTAHRR